MSQSLKLGEPSIKLSIPQREELGAFSFGSVNEVHHWVGDEEVKRRSEELDSGAVRGISREEFNLACGH